MSLFRSCFSNLTAARSGEFEALAPVDHLELDPDRIGDRDHRPCLELESGQHRAEFMDGCRVVAIRQHVSAPVADPADEHLDLEIGRRLPAAEHVEDPLLGILIVGRRALRALVPADHPLHRILPMAAVLPEGAPCNLVTHAYMPPLLFALTA